MSNCECCNRPLGSSKDCEECVRYVVDHGALKLDANIAREAPGRAEKWLVGPGRLAPRNVIGPLKLLIDLVGAYFRGQYTTIPWTTIAVCSFAIFYVVDPIDLVPGFIPVVGYIDDALVIGTVLFAAREDLVDYCRFRGYEPENYGL
jgi:uncharacterized membrane protein YkvA (DUF1232 family)